MNDTPAHIKKLQLQIWLAKPPGERLLQFIIDNDALIRGFDEAKKEIVKQQGKKKTHA